MPGEKRRTPGAAVVKAKRLAADGRVVRGDVVEDEEVEVERLELEEVEEPERAAIELGGPPAGHFR